MSLSAVERSQTYSCELDGWHIAALILYSELERGTWSANAKTSAARRTGFRLEWACRTAFYTQNGFAPVALPCSAPKILENLASSRGITPLRYSSQPSDDSERAARVIAGRQRYQFDALFAAVKLCIAAAGGSLKAIIDKIPHFFLASGDYDTDFAYKTLVMRGGSAYRPGTGCAWNPTPPARWSARFCQPADSQAERRRAVRVIPKRHGGFRIIAEADTMEAAEEMLSLSKRRIDEIIADAQSR